jgi:uncharacterized protein YnzC (UPF0291/DUF896 family)
VRSLWKRTDCDFAERHVPEFDYVAQHHNFAKCHSVARINDYATKLNYFAGYDLAKLNHFPQHHLTKFETAAQVMVRSGWLKLFKSGCLQPLFLP